MSVYVIGAGGHAKVVLATLEAAGTPVIGVLDDDPAKHGGAVLGVPVVGPIVRAANGAHACVIAVGDNAARRRIARSLPNVEWATIVHPNAVVHDTVTLGAGAVVFAGAVVQPETVIGAHAIVNTGATVDHDCYLADYVHIAPGAHLSGNVRLGEGSFLGVGACVVPGRPVGAWSVVGAGAVVVRDVPANVTVAGVPAKAIRERPTGWYQ